MDKIKVMIVEDHQIVRDGIRKIIDMQNDMYVCDEAESANDAIKKIGDSAPQVAIVDISLRGDVSGIDLLKAMRERYPAVFSIVLSMFDESIYAERAIMAGAKGYIMKKEASSKIIDAVRTVIAGELFLSEGISKSIIKKLVHGAADSGHDDTNRLTNREFEVFQLIGNGFSAREISEKLTLSIHTVETHKKNIMNKLSLPNSSKLTKHAVQWVLTQYK